MSANTGVHLSIATFADGALKDGAQKALLLPYGSGREFAVIVQASHLGAGSGAAGRAIERGAGAKHKVARGVEFVFRLREKLNVVDISSVGPGHAVCMQGFTDSCRNFDELPSVRGRQRARGLLHEEEPVSTPCDIPGKAAVSRYIDLYLGTIAIARHIFDGDTSVLVERSLHGAHRGFDIVQAHPNPAKMGEGGQYADGSMAAHA